jgi:BirA family transcriptional regulator, biotin operon repressor / biotin---[acetyl-CoA-carboxylase] ligase
MSAEAAGRILEMLRHQEAPLSGAEMSKTLGISRSAVWKHIKTLRREGYRIEAKPASGYRLVGVPSHPTPWEIQAGLGTAHIGKRIYTFSQASSTNEVAFRLALKGAEEGEVVLAESQTEGKGRMGRPWESPAGLNIYLSIILRPRIVPSKTPLITLMAAVACAEAMDEVAGLLPAIKWPNDLLLERKKLGGILTEADMELDRINFVVVGIGINVNMTRSSFPSSIKDTATSLQEALGREISRIALTQAILRHMEQWYQRLGQGRGEEITRRWKELALIEGQQIEVTSLGEVVRGTALDIDEDGALLVQTDNTTIRRIVAGDVTLKGR